MNDREKTILISLVAVLLGVVLAGGAWMAFFGVSKGVAGLMLCCTVAAWALGVVGGAMNK